MQITAASKCINADIPLFFFPNTVVPAFHKNKTMMSINSGKKASIPNPGVQGPLGLTLNNTPIIEVEQA